ncbi:MAG: leucine-rich repeat protein [Alistipes sp.]|nr:leucine-rich repeat protein [Alistipes sp.]
MKKLFAYLFVAITMIIAGCSESFDDSKIWDKLDDHESRIAKLEELCKQVNTNISSLQTIVNALQNNDYVTGVTPITKNGETVGYTITFSKSQPITIYHGKDGRDGQNGTDGKDGADGKDGTTPIIGVKQDTDGIYYWTLNGEWLLDANGNKIKAQGTDGKDGVNGEDGSDGKDGENGKDGKDGVDGSDGQNGKDGKDGVDGSDGQNGQDGKDGITPQLKIENDYWHISYDNGATWTQLGKATGEDGKDGENGMNGTNGENGKDGDSFFQSVTQDENNVYFTLADGTEIVLPKFSGLNITFSAIGDIACLPGEYVAVDYTISGADSDVYIATITQNGWQAVVTKESASTGYITVTAPNPLTDSPIIVLVSDSNKTIMRTLSFVEGLVVVENASFTLTYEAAMLNVNVHSNLDYTIEIPDAANSWITLESITTRAAVRNDVITLNIAENSEITARSATLQLIFNGESVGTIDIYQQGIKGEIIEFEDSVVEKICLDKWDTSGDGLLSVLEVAAVTNPNDLSGVFEGNINIESFNEFRYFTGLTEVPSSAFKACIKLKEITLPENISSLGYEAFYDCKALNNIAIPATVRYLARECFYNCTSLTNVSLPNSLVEFQNRCFYGCTKLSRINLPENLKEISGWAFYNSGLTEIIIPDAVTEIAVDAFGHCKNLEKVEFGANVKTIGESAFAGCTKLTSIIIPASVRDIEGYVFADSAVSEVVIEYGVQRLGAQVFNNCDYLTSITLPNSVYEMGSGVFGCCDALTKVQLSDNITNIPYGTFRYCNNLAEIILPANLGEINSMAFTRTFNASGDYTRCYIYLRSTTPPTWLGSFQGTPYIYVPSGSKEAYEQDISWNCYDIYEYEL